MSWFVFLFCFWSAPKILKQRAGRATETNLQVKPSHCNILLLNSQKVNVTNLWSLGLCDLQWTLLETRILHKRLSYMGNYMINMQFVCMCVFEKECSFHCVAFTDKVGTVVHPTRHCPPLHHGGLETSITVGREESGFYFYEMKHNNNVNTNIGWWSATIYYMWSLDLKNVVLSALYMTKRTIYWWENMKCI